MRASTEGHQIDWTKIMQIRITRTNKDAILYKTSHEDAEFYELKVPEKRNSSIGMTCDLPKAAYVSSPKLSEGKYNDLSNLCDGPTPVISNPDHVSFYKNLPH